MTEQIRNALETLVGGQIFEIRAIPPIGKPAVFAPDDIQRAAEWAASLSGSVQGVYFTLNPLTQDPLLCGECANDATVLKRRWLPIDVDPVRPADVSATDAEKAAALDRATAVCEHLTSLGWPEPVVMDSGNGYWLLYHIDVPTKDDGLVHRCLKALAARFDNAQAKIDTKTANPSRIAKLPGTVARKGEQTAERPHRVAALVEVPADLVPVPSEKLNELAAAAPATAPATAAPAAVPTAQPQPQEYASVEERIARARAYVEKVDPAISGQHGHDQTYYVAALLVRDFALPEADALPIMEEFNARCQPPWSHEELVRKLREADKKEGPRGCKAGKTNPEKLADAWRYVMKPDGRYYVPSGLRKQEHEFVARMLVISYDLPTWEALPILRKYNEAHGNLAEDKLVEIVHAADKLDRLRGKMWPRKPREDPYRLALESIDENYWGHGQSLLRYHAGDWWAWDGTRYRRFSEEEMKREVSAFVQKEFNLHQEVWARILAEEVPSSPALEQFDDVLAKGEAVLFADTAVLQALAGLDAGRYELFRSKAKRAGVQVTSLDRAVRANGRGRRKPDDPMPVTCKKVADVMQALRGLPYCRAPESMPCMLDGSEKKYIAVQNGLLDRDTFTLVDHTPAWFSSVCLPYKYNPDAPAPTQWLKFLDDQWKEDRESVESLQDWFGLVVAGATFLQKILMLKGPPRSGKGTVSNVLKALIGEDAYAGVQLSELAARFGLEALLGKSLAVIQDARFDPRYGAQLVERLLSISGEDDVMIDRKNKRCLTQKLPTLLMVNTNELPKMTDTSGALASRFVILEMTQSFLGKEDPLLGEKLATELPGILNWALEGWKRIKERKQLVQPSSSRHLVEELRGATSMMYLFVQECCVLDPEKRVEKPKLFEAWRQWCCNKNLSKYEGNSISFGHNLKTAFPQIRDGKTLGSREDRDNAYLGVDLRPAA